jgi:hypothetical protein
MVYIFLVSRIRISVTDQSQKLTNWVFIITEHTRFLPEFCDFKNRFQLFMKMLGYQSNWTVIQKKNLWINWRYGKNILLKLCVVNSSPFGMTRFICQSVDCKYDPKRQCRNEVILGKYNGNGDEGFARLSKHFLFMIPITSICFLIESRIWEW